MAPVPVEPEVRYLPLAVSIGHVLGVAYLTWAVARSLYRSYLQLSPAQDTRARISRRWSLAPVFASLAIVSLVLAGQTWTTYATLSYKVWANQRGIEVPALIYGDKGIFPSNENATAIYIARWLSDTPVYMDAFEIVAEKARRFWWGQQIDLATLSWGLLLSIEGRRRNIPFLWAYLGLAHMVNLSFAQNLFYLALIFTPTPIPVAGWDDSLPASRYIRIRNSLFPPKPANWCPHPFLLLASYVFNSVALFLVPMKAGTPSFANVVLLTRAFTFMPLIIPTVAPVSWGTVHPHPHSAYGAFSDLFRLISALGFLLHGKATMLGLFHNAPDAHHHRHSVLLPFDKESRGAWERTTLAFGRVLGATSDHPVVTGIGWDVVISAISLGLWSAVRNLGAEDILTCSVPLYKKPELTAPAPDFKEEPDVPAIKTEGGDTTIRRRGRPPKPKVPFPGVSAGEQTPAPSPRKRGRPRKVKIDPEDAPGDDTYRPTPSESASAVEGDIITEGNMDWESTALAWGLTVVGGLGCGSAGVFGGECISR